jgi:hypothetical protein
MELIIKEKTKHKRTKKRVWNKSRKKQKNKQMTGMNYIRNERKFVFLN